MGTSPEEIDTRKQGSDRILLMSVIMLMIFGVLAVYSSIAYFAETRGTTAANLLSGHMIKLGIAFIVMLIASKIDYHVVIRFSRIALVISWLLLIAVMIYGDLVFGARRSLTIAGFSFQPSSVATVALLIHIAVLLYEKQEYIKDFKKAFLPILFWILPTCALIGLEDFSSAALLLAICFTLMFIGRISVRHLAALVLIGLIGGGALLSTSAERQSRVQQYVNQISDINSTQLEPGAGYQAQQSYIAIAQGKMFGVGIGKSTQRDFLPAPYNDFIFSIIAEEYGIAGAGLIILLIVTILIRGIVFIVRNAEDSLGMLLASACTITIALYGFVNAGVASGLLPVTGLPMPFISYGGTSMLFTALMVGILMNISKHNRNRKSTFYYG
jgi:cell division protein FtsW